MSVLRVRQLPVLDLTDPDVTEHLGVTRAQLMSNRYEACRRMRDLARSAPERFGGILAPSGADRDNPDATTLVVFREWLADHVEVEGSRIASPTPDLMGLFERVVRTLPPALRGPAAATLARIRRELGR